MLKCSLSTEGAGSPLIYSTGEISVSKTKGIATGAQMVVVEGKNTANVFENSELKCNGIGNRKNIDACGVMLYQSFSGDAATVKVFLIVKIPKWKYCLQALYITQHLCF